MSTDETDARDMLADEGQTVTVAGTASSTYDPATDTVTPTAYSATASAALVPLSPYRMEKDTNIVSGDERMLLSAVDANGNAIGKPPLDSLVTLADGTSKYTIVAVDPLHPAGTDLLYDCVVRGRK